MFCKCKKADRFLYTLLFCFRARDNLPFCFRALEVATCLWHALSNDRSGAENEPIRVHSNLSNNKSKITFSFAFVR